MVLWEAEESGDPARGDEVLSGEAGEGGKGDDEEQEDDTGEFGEGA